LVFFSASTLLLLSQSSVLRRSVESAAKNGHAALQGPSVRQRLRLLIEVVAEKSAMKS
jgi:hypothetical protein